MDYALQSLSENKATLFIEEQAIVRQWQTTTEQQILPRKSSIGSQGV
jgi:hypothetical protein